MILRAALQMLQQRLAERVDKGGDRQLLLILRQTAPLLQGLAGTRSSHSQMMMWVPTATSALWCIRVCNHWPWGHLHFAVFSQGSPGEIARHQERTATEMKHGHDLPHCATGTIPVTDKWDDRV